MIFSISLYPESYAYEELVARKKFVELLLLVKGAVRRSFRSLFFCVNRLHIVSEVMPYIFFFEFGFKFLLIYEKEHDSEMSETALV